MLAQLCLTTRTIFLKHSYFFLSSGTSKRTGPYRTGGDRSRVGSVTGSTTFEEEPAELKIQAADMPLEMQRSAVFSATQAIKLYSTEKHIAESIKQDFDQMYHPTWHCIVGRNWGSCVTHSKQCYIRLAYKDLTILLYRSTWKNLLDILKLFLGYCQLDLANFLRTKGAQFEVATRRWKKVCVIHAETAQLCDIYWLMY